MSKKRRASVVAATESVVKKRATAIENVHCECKIAPTPGPTPEESLAWLFRYGHLDDICRAGQNLFPFEFGTSMTCKFDAENEENVVDEWKRLVESAAFAKMKDRFVAYVREMADQHNQQVPTHKAYHKESIARNREKETLAHRIGELFAEFHFIRVPLKWMPSGYTSRVFLAPKYKHNTTFYFDVHLAAWSDWIGDVKLIVKIPGIDIQHIDGDTHTHKINGSFVNGPIGDMRNIEQEIQRITDEHDYAFLFQLVHEDLLREQYPFLLLRASDLLESGWMARAASPSMRPQLEGEILQVFRVCDEILVNGRMRRTISNPLDLVSCIFSYLVY